MTRAGILFPHQLFEDNPLMNLGLRIYLVEEYLFFSQYPFHKRKIAFHRASMKGYEAYLQKKGVEVVYIDAHSDLSDIRNLIPWLKSAQNIQSIAYIDPTDNWLEKRILQSCDQHQMNVRQYATPLFLNAKSGNEAYFSEKKKFFQTDFYKQQRLNHQILIEKNQKPLGGKWTFDTENRLKYPKGKTPPNTAFPEANAYYLEAIDYTEKHFPDHYGALDASFLYPCTFEASRAWLQDFLKTRFFDFGSYEDAMVATESILHHSVLTPMLNVGLLTPQRIVEETLAFASENEIPLNSLEGFIRQIIGWREFIRAVYELKGTEVRTRNYWGFTRKIPPAFWTGETGIEPFDLTVKKALKTGYCHHIERLMVLGNFMLLCEFDPDEVYRWFMALFIDAYDWVMVPNVYGMSQYADGGLMTTKPYISGSNYLLKMSDFKTGPWQSTWDGLFWRFMHTHRDFFLQNPRLGMLVNTFDKMPHEKQQTHLGNAERFLASI